MGRLSGKTAIITGAGQGLGLAIAELFAKEGAKVVGTGRHVEKVEKAFRKYRTIRRHIWRCLFRQSSGADSLIYRQ